MTAALGGVRGIAAAYIQKLSAHACYLAGTWEEACCLQVTQAMQALQQREGWGGLPLYGLGISSGGAMVLLLAHRLEMQVGACSHGCQGCLWSLCWLTCRWGHAAMVSRAACMLLLADMLQMQVGGMQP